MNEIHIISEGKVISRVLSGERVRDVAAVLEGDVFVVCDRTVLPLAEEIVGACAERRDSRPPVIRAVLALETSEEKKNLDTVMDICRRLLENGADRGSLLLAVGGGIATDMAGFAASIYKRGIRFAFVPTTLLAQVDAAIGGKTGVNFLDYKNMLGVIRQPEWTWISPEPLRTLPLRDFRSGAAELLKTFLIEDRNDNYARAVRLLTELCGTTAGGSTPAACMSPETERELQELIAGAAAVKAGVVSRDAEEHGERRKLNLGHTFAHGIESVARRRGYDISHGEAVAIGILLAARLAEKLGLTESPDGPASGGGLASRMAADFAACGLPTASPFPLEELAEAMTKDKKAEAGAVRFILPVAVGSVVEKTLTVREALDLLGKGQTCPGRPREDASRDLRDTGATGKEI